VKYLIVGLSAYAVMHMYLLKISNSLIFSSVHSALIRPIFIPVQTDSVYLLGII